MALGHLHSTFQRSETPKLRNRQEASLWRCMTQMVIFSTPLVALRLPRKLARLHSSIVKCPAEVS